MEHLDNLEKLARLRDKDIVSEEEFQIQKTAILDNLSAYSGSERKSGVAYALLAWFLGIFGAHNFYAGYTKRAIIQLLITLFSWIFLFVPVIFVQIWALADMCLINKDAAGEAFRGVRHLITVIRAAAIAFYVVIYFMAFSGLMMLYNYNAVVSGGNMPAKVMFIQ